MEALRSAGPANAPPVTDARFAVLEEELGKGPAAHGFDDERWTLARFQRVIRRRLRVRPSATEWRLPRRPALGKELRATPWLRLRGVPSRVRRTASTPARGSASQVEAALGISVPYGRSR